MSKALSLEQILTPFLNEFRPQKNSPILTLLKIKFIQQKNREREKKIRMKVLRNRNKNSELMVSIGKNIPNTFLIHIFWKLNPYSTAKT